MLKLFIDSDVIIDLFMDRKPFVHSARHVMGMLEAGKAEGCTSSLVIANVYYLLSKYLNKNKSLEVIRKLTSILYVIPIENNHIQNAINNPGKDFEDKMQHLAAVSAACNYLVTRNISDYSNDSSCIPILPEYALNILSQ